MGPPVRKFWCPLHRLGAFFVGVVVAGTIVFEMLRPPEADLVPTLDEWSDTFNRRKRRIERQIQRYYGRFLGGFSQVPADPEGEPVLLAVGRPAIAPEPVGVVLAAAPEALPAVTSTPAPKLAFLEPDSFFTWPSPLPPLRRPGPPLPESIQAWEGPTVTPELVSEFYRRGAADPLSDVADAILLGPEFLLDSVFAFADGMSGRPPLRRWDDDPSITGQIFQVSKSARQERITATFLQQLASREARYFAQFGESRANSVGFEDGTQDVDREELIRDQRKVLWDALRRTYVSRYKLQAEEKMKEDAWYVDRWSALDVVVLPPLLGAYVFYRGFDKRFGVAGTSLKLSIEPLSEWVRGRQDLSCAAGIEWSMKGLPLSVIVTAGVHDGRYGVDFAGVGTTLGAVRRLVLGFEEERRRN